MIDNIDELDEEVANYVAENPGVPVFAFLPDGDNPNSGQTFSIVDVAYDEHADAIYVYIEVQK